MSLPSSPIATNDALPLDADKQRLLAIEVAKILNVDNVETDVGIGELGIDSLNIVELIIFCEQLYGSFDPEALELSQYTTLADLHGQLSAETP
ncbi:MAG: acyl carrier protein [Pseudomonadota bacterium]|nr:acyl carrier protein [Pseudomonadota bacterium]